MLLKMQMFVAISVLMVASSICDNSDAGSALDNSDMVQTTLGTEKPGDHHHRHHDHHDHGHHHHRDQHKHSHRDHRDHHGRRRNIGPNLLTVYMNLDDRPDRKEEIERELKGFHAVRVPAVKVEPAYVGCEESHVNALLSCQKMYNESSDAAGLKGCAVFEDDFMWSWPREKRGVLNDFVADDSNAWDILILSGSFLQDSYKSSPVDDFEGEPMERVLDIHASAGYVVNFKYVSTLLAAYQEGLDNLKKGVKPYLDKNSPLPGYKDKEYYPSIGKFRRDQVWKPLQKTGIWYTFKDRPGTQRPGISSIEGKFTNYSKMQGTS